MNLEINRGRIINGVLAGATAFGGLVATTQKVNADTPTPGPECSTRASVRSEWTRPDGSIIGPVRDRRYLVEAIGRSNVMVTNANGVGVIKQGDREITFVEFRGRSDAVAVNRPAMIIRFQSLNSGESIIVTVPCGQRFNLDSKVKVAPNMTVTPGAGPTFEPRGSVIAKTPAVETPIRGIGTPEPTRAANTSTVTSSPTPSSTPKAESSPAAPSPSASPSAEATPSATPVPVVGSSGSSGPDFRFLGDAVGNGWKIVQESLLPGALAGVALLVAAVNRPGRPRTRVWNAAAWPYRRIRYGATGTYPGPFRVI